MPLLKKETFQKTSSQEFLRDDEEVFYCEITNEIFREYEDFAKRMLLCNSMVWTCSLTGKSNLTYLEAVESEENAKRSIQEFPKELILPILFIASKTKRAGFGEMAEDVLMYMKDRYFVGENLETSFTGNNWKEYHVIHVIPPTDAEIKKATKNGKKHINPPASLFKYEIENLDADDQDISEIMIVDCNQIRRKETSFSREKCKLFLKQYVEQDESGIFVIKQSALKNYNIENQRFDKIFGGPLPCFEPSKKTKSINGKKSRQETLAKYLTKTNGVENTKEPSNKQPTSKNLLEEMVKRQEEFQRLKQEKEEQKLILKQKQKEHNLQISLQLKEWYKPREDLELEDQQALPEFVPIISKIPQEFIGSVLMIMEFIKSFDKFLKFKNFFNGPLTFEMMERALIEKEVAGPLIDLIQMLLTAIFREQEDEAAEYSTAFESVKDVTKFTSRETSYYEASKFATLAAKWPKQHQGLYLRNIPLYSLTLTEVLRLHLLSSGARVSDSCDRGRYLHRGGYNSTDDPGLHLRLHKPHILKSLAVYNVVQLPMGDKIDILSCLVDQLLTFADIRNSIEDRIEKNRQIRIDLRSAQTVERKRENDHVSAKFKIKKEGKEDPDAAALLLDRLERKEEKKKVEYEREIELLMKSCYEKEVRLGMDRAYREYLKLKSLPGVLVNFEYNNPGTCLPEPIKQITELISADRNTIINHVRKLFDEMNSSDKENNPKKSPKKVNGDLGLTNGTDLSNLLMCSADESCVVHETDSERTRWFFLDNKEILDQLINTLNKRGLRESELQQTLQNDKANLVKFISKTPIQQLNLTLEVEQEEEVVRFGKRTRNKKYQDSNFGFPPGTNVEEILQSTLTDDLLEMEEKIYGGSLGQLYCKDREKWRHVLLTKDYASFDKDIVKRKDVEYDQAVMDEETVLPEYKHLEKYCDPGGHLGPVNGVKDIDGSEKFTQSEEIQLAVECLAIALAQIAQAVEPKYLKKPLGDSTKGLTNNLQIRDRLNSWEQSLMTSTSFSQVFLHYSTLDSCIMWSRSTLLAKCRICRRQKDSKNMLLCDSCNLGHHLYCLKPKLCSVPKGDWFCNRCTAVKEKAEAKQRSSSAEVIPKKKRRIFKEEEEEEEQEEEEAEEEEEEEIQNEIEVESQESESENEDEEAESSLESATENEDDESEDTEVNLCAVCKSGGTMMACEKCSSYYHKECTQPPLRRVKQHWTCQNCKENQQDINKKETNKKEESDFWCDGYLVQRTGVSNQRRCAAKARHNIHNFARSLRRLSTSDDSGTEDPQTAQRKRSYRRESGREDLPLHNAALQDLLTDVMKHRDAWPFLRPVQKNEVPDYYDVITHPMDLGTIKYKLNMGEYKQDSQLMYDALLIFQNCNTYNECDSEIYNCGDRLFEFFTNKCTDLGLKIPGKKANEIEPVSKKRRAK